MNIFVLDEDVKKNVECYVDRHIVKMILETSQLLCSVHHCCGVKAPYALTHKNHPCSVWTRGSLSNYKWLCGLGLELCREYTYRYGKIHKSQEILEWCVKNNPNIKDLGLTNFCQAMPEKYKSNNAIKSYRDYYNGEKRHLFKWTKREKPHWVEKINEKVLDNLEKM